MLHTGDEICDFCIDVIAWWSNNSPLSYGELNVLLFIILQPLLIIAYCITTIVASVTKSKKLKKYLFVFGIIGIIILIVGTCILLGFPLLDGSFQMKSSE